MSSHVSELTINLARFAERCRSARWFGALFHVGIAQDIAADIATSHDKIRETATNAANFDLEALAQIESATARDSDGGAAITPGELRRIKPLIVKSATLDNHAANLARCERVVVPTNLR